ncbi:MAG: diguanylate cyclase [Proteobacteria bacterium]|nr:diguanylate cyclase [Pseudomonadota bacterium]MBU2227128.1 diguanylate cyclase [Pseudomonadota bacterium]MBU2262665.1 diguanylate cyclase [Pseudomonadota bacterium]
MSVIKNPITSRENRLLKAGFRLLLLVCVFCLPAIAGIARAAAPLTEITVVSDDNYPPYIFRDHTGRLQGILVDEWRLWEQKTGIRVDLRGMDWDQAQKTMTEGKAQVIDTIFFTEERAKKLDYSAPYASIDVPIFFHKDISGIKDVNSLHGFTVGVKAGDAAIDFLTSHGIDTLQEYPSYESIVRAAQEDKIKVFCIDGPPALYFLYKLNLEQDYRQTAPLYTGQFHRAVPKGRKDLLTVVEQGFAKISRRERAQIEKRWLGAPIFLPHYLPYVFYVTGAFAILGVILLLWNHTLRRKVTQKTAQLRETIDALRKSEEEQCRDREDAERLAEEMAVIAEIGRVIGSSLDIDEVYERFAAEVRKLIPFERLAINLCSVHDDTLSIAYVFGSDVSGRMRGDSLSLSGTVSGEVIRTRTGLILNPQNADEVVAQFPALLPTFQAGLRSLLGVPLISRDEAIGALHFRSKTPNAYTEQDLQLAERIGAQIAGAIANAQLFADRKRMEEEIREMSFRDQMTELYNRRGFTTLTEQQLKAANRAKRPMRLTFIDCDGLKGINDTLGHEEGDRALIDTANVLRQTFRESDILARTGGDEFAVLSIDAADMNPESFSKRLQRNIDKFNAGGTRPFKLSMSWGTAVYDPESPLSLDELMSSADGLMYAQKKAKCAIRRQDPR